MSADGTKTPQMTNEEVVAQFQVLRNEQRNMADNVGQYEMDLKEHRTVIDTLKTIAGGRKCFRLIGGVLCESNVETVLPQLTDSKGQLEKLIESMNEQLTKKGAEINQFREKHNIRFEGMPKEAAGGDGAKEEKATKENRTVLVVNN